MNQSFVINTVEPELVGISPIGDGSGGTSGSAVYANVNKSFGSDQVGIGVSTLVAYDTIENDTSSIVTSSTVFTIPEDGVYDLSTHTILAISPADMTGSALILTNIIINGGATGGLQCGAWSVFSDSQIPSLFGVASGVVRNTFVTGDTISVSADPLFNASSSAGEFDIRARPIPPGTTRGTQFFITKVA